MFKCIIQLHFSTGAYYLVSGLFGHGKASVWCIVHEEQGEALIQEIKLCYPLILWIYIITLYPAYSILRGITLPPSLDVIKNCQEFTIKFVYGDNESKSLAVLCTLKWPGKRKNQNSKLTQMRSLKTLQHAELTIKIKCFSTTNKRTMQHIPLLPHDHLKIINNIFIWKMEHQAIGKILSCSSVWVFMVYYSFSYSFIH